MKALCILLACLAVPLLSLLWFQANNRNRAESPPVRVSAEQFYEDYQASPARADVAYKGRRVEVSGTANSLLNDGLTLYTDYFLGHVRCTFLRPDSLGSVARGQKVRLVGVCPGGRAVLTGCSLVE